MTAHILFFLLSVCSAYLTDPPTTADPKTVSDCSNWIVAKAGDKCDEIASEFSISVTDFGSVYNPSVGPSCKLSTGDSYCVERNYGIPSSVPSPTKPAAGQSATTKPTQTSKGITTPLPTQPGMTSNCNKFYKPATDEDCSYILSSQGISMADFYEWNKGVGMNCETMWADTYQCVGVIGGESIPRTTSRPTPTTPQTATTTMSRSGNGISTPQPTQPGISPNCDKFYKVQQGEGCWDITVKFGISLDDFYAWNAGVGSNCEKMWANTYQCVHVFK
ncbi:hypothetical protein QBC47DRAFT_298828 [Echria macrotheca]|uniref:LysM domain-containing protein n=1 Tax=Echria macrotheca TaxID=438768 RepID=A0AAJ0BE58_9PEZI|nr:hypothetical protein QBC47DRAFT_298828 [Echria macrotheca]